jgi:peptidoglycan/xylan/chitin deacetylase (PgdA/CDA1 family)
MAGALALGAGTALAAAGCRSNDTTATDGSTSAPSTDPGTTSTSGALDSTTTSSAGAAVTTTATGSPSSPAASTKAPTTPTTLGPARFVDHGITSGHDVALTFHTNGDLKLAQQLLDIVKAHQVPITCFVIGSWLEANPTWGAKLRDAGHELANHTYTHPDFTKLSATAMVGEITKCRDVLRKYAGDGGRFFRPSGTDDGTVDPGPTIAAAAGQVGYPMLAGFNVDPYDYQDPGADAVTSRTLAAVKPGAIVSLHFGHQATVAALPAVLDGIAGKGLTPVTLSSLVG